MSKYSEHTSKYNNHVKENMEKFFKAKNAMEQADAERNKLRKNRPTAIEAANYAVADAVYQEARVKFIEAEREYKNSIDSDAFKSIREDFVKSVNEDYAAKPEHIDDKIMTLLNSNIMTATEYDRLIDQQIAQDNITMARIIAGAARKKSDEVEDRTEKANLRAVSYKAPRDMGKEYIEMFDALHSAYRRCTNNYELAKRWDELTAPIIEKI